MTRSVRKPQRALRIEEHVDGIVSSIGPKLKQLRQAGHDMRHTAEATPVRRPRPLLLASTNTTPYAAVRTFRKREALTFRPSPASS